jgi:L-amino acid N-acyltransferase YncA
MTSGIVNIRSACKDDLAGILDIYNHAIIHTTSVYSEHAHTYEMRLTWYNDRISSGFPVFVAVTDGQIVGFSHFWAIQGMALLSLYGRAFCLRSHRLSW